MATNKIIHDSLYVVSKLSNDTTTITLTVDTSKTQLQIMFFGRLGYDNHFPALGVISVSCSNGAITLTGVKVLSDLSCEVSGEGSTLTITTAQTYASLTFVSDTRIS